MVLPTTMFPVHPYYTSTSDGRRGSFTERFTDCSEKFQDRPDDNLHISKAFFDETNEFGKDTCSGVEIDHLLSETNFLDDFDMASNDLNFSCDVVPSYPVELETSKFLSSKLASRPASCSESPDEALSSPILSPASPLKNVELVDIYGNSVRMRDTASPTSNCRKSFAKSVTPDTTFKKPLKQIELPPLRALSAYNFFFRDQRERLLYGGELEFTAEKSQQLLSAHWNRDRAAKRKHRKTHGKIPFTELSKMVSKRWKELSENNKEFYRQVSSKDWERYQKELSEHKSRIATLPPKMSMPMAA